MANVEHLAKLKEGVEVWNRWRNQNPKVQPDLDEAWLPGADLSGANLRGVNLRRAELSHGDLGEASLRGADLSGTKVTGASLYKADLREAKLEAADLRTAGLYGADLRGTNLSLANLRGVNLGTANLSEANLATGLSDADLSLANLSGANLCGADLLRANLHNADLSRANLSGALLAWADLSIANLTEANLSQAHLNGVNLIGARLIKAKLCEANLEGAVLNEADLRLADLRRADLTGATLIETNLEAANLTGCFVYGISAWNVKLGAATIQSNLVITPFNESPIQVDNLEVAQFIYLLLNNEKIRSVIETITSKVVLILGRFTPDRIVVLEAIREELRKRDYLPVLFDFEKPSSQTTVETISTLAHMARFVIADLTDAKSVLQELQAVVPLSPSVVVQPLLLASQEEPGMFDFIRQFPWVLDTHRYTDQPRLLAELKQEVIDPAEAKATELAQKRQK